MSDISKSYPYLSIAKKHGVDYSTVLALADFATHGRGAGFYECDDSHLITDAVLEDINDAARYFKGIRDGRIPFPAT